VCRVQAVFERLTHSIMIAQSVLPVRMRDIHPLAQAEGLSGPVL
jgi:hypothetical protein